MGRGHGHGHGHGHAANRAADRTRLRWVLAVTVTVLVVEVVGGLLTGSLALLADAGHMATDAGAIVLALGASGAREQRRLYEFSLRVSTKLPAAAGAASAPAAGASAAVARKAV